MKYRGIIVAESLDDDRILNNMTIIKMCVTGQDKKEDRWHLYEVEIDEKEIENISKHTIEGWYNHFWRGTDVAVVFTNKIMKFNYLDKETWKEVLEYGRKLNIPEHQLDFPIFGL